MPILVKHSGQEKKKRLFMLCGHLLAGHLLRARAFSGYEPHFIFCEFLTYKKPIFQTKN